MEITKNGLKKPSREDFYNVETFNENMDIIDGLLDNATGGGIEVLTLSIASNAWVLDSTTGLYKATISWSGITSNHVVDVVFDLPSIELASDVINYTNTAKNCFYLYSSSVVSNTLTGVAYAKVVIV